MGDNDAFGLEIDDDGLPKYSPDRKNIAAFHMYKLGLTDKLPDPEDTHTPFFRTPSYYKDKALREQREAPDVSPMPDFPKQDKSDPYALKPFRLDKPAEIEPPAIKPLEDFKPDIRVPGRIEESGSRLAPSSRGSGGTAFQEVFGKVRDAYLKEFFGEKRLADPSFGTVPFRESSPESGFEDMLQPKIPLAPYQNPASGQELWSEGVGLPFQLNQPVPVLPRPDMINHARIPGAADGAIRAIQPVPDLTGSAGHDGGLNDALDDSFLKRRLEQWQRDMENDGPAAIPLGLAREPSGASQMPDGENGAVHLTDSEPVPVQTGFDKAGAAAGWVNRDSSQVYDGQGRTGFSVDDLEAPSAGKGQPARRGFRSAFTGDNPANPRFQPMQVALLSPGQLPIPKGRREVTPEMTNGINSDLTRLNRGWPIGINFTVLSRLEGGSFPYANLPIAKAELDMERCERQEALKQGKTPPVRKWANNSGATIGSGFDLGQTSVDEMRGLGFPESLVQKCAPYVGKRRLDADDLLRKRPLVLSLEEIDIVNRQVMSDKAQKSIQDWDSRIAILKKTNPQAPYFHEMNSAQQTIVFSRYYHQGPGWHQRRSNAPMFEAMKRNDWGAVNQQMQGLVNRLEKSGPKWLWSRFRNELWFLNWKY